MSEFPILIYRFSTFPIRIPAAFFFFFLHSLRSCSENSYGNEKDPEEPKYSLKEKKNKGKNSGFLISNLLQTIVIKPLWYGHKDRHTDQGKITEIPEITS